MTSPRTVLAPALMVKPLTPAPALVPSSSTIGALVQPGRFCASSTTEFAIAGRAEAGLIVAAPPAM